MILRDQPLDHRHLQQRAGRHRDRAVPGQVLLVEREEAAGGGDPVHAVGDQFVSRRLEPVQHVGLLEVHHLGRRGAADDPVLDRERPGERVADIADETAKGTVDHQAANGHPVVGLRPAHAGASSSTWWTSMIVPAGSRKKIWCQNRVNVVP